MRLAVVPLLMAPLLLTACGEAKKAFDQGFEKNYHKEFVASCSAAAVKAGSGPDVANNVCDCTATKIIEKYPGSAAARLNDAQMEVEANACLQQLGIEAQQPAPSKG